MQKIESKNKGYYCPKCKKHTWNVVNFYVASPYDGSYCLECLLKFIVEKLELPKLKLDDFSFQKMKDENR